MLSLFPYNSFKEKKISFPYTHKVIVQIVPTGLKGRSPCLFPVLSIHNFIRALVNLLKYILFTYVILPIKQFDRKEAYISHFCLTHDTEEMCVELIKSHFIDKVLRKVN